MPKCDLKSPEPPRDIPAGAQREHFYVTGGALSLKSASYVPRRADEELFSALGTGEFCYVLTSRQRGKSSLMIRTAYRLRVAGHRVALLDLTRVGQNVTPEQWYLGLLDLLGESLNLQEKLDKFWNEQKETGPMHRWFNALIQLALPASSQPLVIFVDEVDVVDSLPFSTTEFFAAIRECYNRRTQDLALQQLSFCLLGVASVADLIRDPRATPFNIGRRIELTDFTAEEAHRLGVGLNSRPDQRRRMMERTLHWTHGHPYLTQRICAALALVPASGPADVDRACKELFLGHDARKREDNLLFVARQLSRPDVDRTGLLELYRQVRRGGRVRDADTDPLIEALRLSGITRSEQGQLQVRNRIYRKVFDEDWISQNLPESEVRRQRQAFRKGVRGGLFAAAVVAVVIFLSFLWLENRQGHQQCDELGAVYDKVRTYSDSSLITLQTGPLSIGVETRFAFARPNKFRMDSSLKIIFGEMQVHGFCDGQNIWIYVPTLNEYMEQTAPPDLAAYLEKGAQIEPMFEILRQAIPIYATLLSANARQSVHEHAQNLRLEGEESIEGQPARRFGWIEKSISRVPQGDGNFLNEEVGIPTKVWARQADGLFVKSTTDLKALRVGLGDNKVQIMKFSGTNNMTAVAEHRDIRINSQLDNTEFTFHPPAGARQVVRLDFTRTFPVFLDPSRPLLQP
ncbi:MAG: AAA-like domain-containing protein [Verrucomicrobiota bacterium]|jgi:outer membrane lipoprotein-sorting protein